MINVVKWITKILLGKETELDKFLREEQQRKRDTEQTKARCLALWRQLNEKSEPKPCIVNCGRLSDQPSDSNQSSGRDLHSPYYSRCDEVLEPEIIEEGR